MVMKKSKKKETMSVSEFKTHALEVFEQISQTGHPVLITKRGKPIAKVIPLHDGKKAERIPGLMQDTLIELGDIMTPFGAKLWKAAEE